MSSEFLSQDYYDIYQEQFKALIGHADRFMNSSSHEATIEWPDDRLIAENAGLAADIDIKVGTTALLATLSVMKKQMEQGASQEELPKTPLSYEHAEWHLIRPAPDLEIMVTKLHGVEHVGTVAEYSFRLIDNVVDHSLKLMVLGSEVANADAEVRPCEDKDLDRWSSALGIHMRDILPLLWGEFGDEDELDFKLGLIWQQFVGSSQEETMTPLLDEVRLRAMATKEGLQLAVTYDPPLTQPAADTLNMWKERLAAA